MVHDAKGDQSQSPRPGSCSCLAASGQEGAAAQLPPVLYGLEGPKAPLAAPGPTLPNVAQQRGNCPQTVPLLLRCRFPNYCPFASEPRVSKQKQWREGPAGAGDNPNDSLALLSPSSVPLSTAGYSSGSLFMQPPPPSTFQKEEDLCQISSTAAEQGEKAQVDTRPSALTLQSAHGVSDTACEQKPTATDKGMASRSSVHLRCKGMHGPSSHTTAEPAAVPPLGTSLFPHHTAAPSPKCHGGQLKPRAPPREGKAEQSRREQRDSPGLAQNAQKADSHQRRRQNAGRSLIILSF